MKEPYRKYRKKYRKEYKYNDPYYTATADLCGLLFVIGISFTALGYRSCQLTSPKDENISQETSETSQQEEARDSKDGLVQRLKCGKIEYVDGKKICKQVLEIGRHNRDDGTARMRYRSFPFQF